MYTGGSAYGATRIHNPNPDPAEQGPPKRVNREEAHIGEIVAASKRRITWQFTLGEGETIHEVMLIHSIMSYKKKVEYDGRHMHFSSTATPGDWVFSMVLDGANYVIEVRINDSETDDIPKYDLVIDRIPFRRWDVYRRRKPQTGGYSSSYSSQPSLTSSNTFGTHKWGPSSGAPTDTSAPHSYHSNYEHNDRYSSSERLPTYPAHSTSQPKPTPVSKAPSSPEKEINLIGDFGDDIGSVSSPPPQFDPFSLGNAQTINQPTMQQGFNAPPPAPVPSTNPFDPFATSAQPLPVAQPLPIAKPPMAQMNLDPLASQNSTYMQRTINQSAPSFASAGTSTIQQHAQLQGMGVNMGMGMNSMGTNPSMSGMNPGMSTNPFVMAPMQQKPHQQQAFGMNSGGMPVYPTQHYGNVPPNKPAPGGVNYNISQLMNPMDVNIATNAQQAKTINIDPFAGMTNK